MDAPPKPTLFTPPQPLLLQGVRSFADANNNRMMSREFGDDSMFDTYGDGAIDAEYYVKDGPPRVDPQYGKLLFAIFAMFSYFAWLMVLANVGTKNTLRSSFMAPTGLDFASLSSAKTTDKVWAWTLDFFERQVPSASTTGVRNARVPIVQVNH